MENDDEMYYFMNKNHVKNSFGNLKTECPLCIKRSKNIEAHVISLHLNLAVNVDLNGKTSQYI